MSSATQKTLAGSIPMAGIGLHSGAKVQIRLIPAAADTGIIFKRPDLTGGAAAGSLNGASPNGSSNGVLNGFGAKFGAKFGANGGRHDGEFIRIAAHPASVADTRLGTRLQNLAGVSIATVEHLMAAFAICSIDNVIVEVDGAELPILDGSAAPFVEAICQEGLIEQDAARRMLAPVAPVRIEDGERYISLEPSKERTLEISIDFEDGLIGRQALCVDLDDPVSLRSRLAPARTFCCLRDVETMRAAGFSRGGSLDNALVVDGDRLLNDTELRDPSEFVLHKALDFLGDLYLLGAPVSGRIRAHKPGHDINTAFARRVASDMAVSAGGDLRALRHTRVAQPAAAQ